MWDVYTAGTKNKRSRSRVMLKGQSCDNAATPAHARKHSRGWSWAVLRDQGFNNLPSHTHRHRAHGNAHPEQRGQSKRRTVKGGWGWQPLWGWPPLLSEKMTLISQSLFRTREEAKRTKKWQRSLRIVCAAGIPESSRLDVTCLAWMCCQDVHAGPHAGWWVVDLRLRGLCEDLQLRCENW